MQLRALLGLGLSLLAGMTAAAQQPEVSQADPSALPTIPVASSPDAETRPPAPAEPAGSAQLDEVVVTASKRKESTRTLAGAVTAVTRERLDETGSSNFADYLALSPGVNLNSAQPGQSTITMRGVSTDTIPTLTQTAVGIYFDDIPLTDPGTPVMVPDLDAYDADRIEVLRGPQGALFGSASMGGAINYIPRAPNPGELAFSARASGSRTENAATGYSGKLMANLPIAGDVAGLRLVGHYAEIPGWIDNVGTGVAAANAARIGGGRAILGWDVTPESKLRLTGLYQKGAVDDMAFLDGSGDLRKDTLVPEASMNRITIGSLRYDYEADYGSWSLIGGYQQKRNAFVSDQSPFLGVQGLGVAAPASQIQGVKGYSAELRFASRSGGFFEYLAGVSYADRTETFEQAIDLELPGVPFDLPGTLSALLGQLPPAVGGLTTLFHETLDQHAPEAAVFLDTTWRLTSNLKLVAGGRYYRNEVDADLAGQGLLFLPSGSPTFSQHLSDRASGFNPRVSLSYRSGRQLLLYGLYSRGYRLGGVNIAPNTPVTPTKPAYGSDQVHNFELGAKSSWLHNRLVLDVTGFYIDWKNIPLSIQDSAGLFRYQDNVGDARIYGVETGIAFRPFGFLTLHSAVTWNKATLQNAYDPGNGRPPVRPGDQLPGAPEWMISNVVTARWFLGGFYPAISLIHRYESESPSNLSYKNVMKGGYSQLDVRAGARIRNVGITLFGRNLADVRGLTAVQPYAQQTGGIYRRDFVTTPRTFGLELECSYGG